MSTTSDSFPAFPTQGRLLGIDYGTVRVGISICNGEWTIASPLEIYTRRNLALDAKYFRELVQDNRPAGLVVGLPMHVNGTEGSKAREAREYGAWLSDLTGLPVTFWDERYTSAVAEEFLLAAEMTRKQRKARIDKLAAQILLQGFLDHQQAKRREEQRLEEELHTGEEE